MNKQSLYLAGGALLASTALSSTAHAVATIQAASAAVIAGTAVFTASTDAYVPLGVATQVFPTTTSSAATVTLGTTSSEIFVDVSPTIAPFDLKLDISTNAAFVTSPSPTVALYARSTTGSLEAITGASLTGCAVQPSAERITVVNCNVTNHTQSRVDVIGIRGLQYTAASDLRTAGTGITLSGGTFLTNSNNSIDGITPAAVVTSKSVSTDATVQAGTNAVIDNNASPAFTLLVSSGATTTTSAVLGSVHFSVSGALSTDLSNTFASYASIASTTEVKISHSVLADGALNNITFDSQTKSSPQFVGTTVSFQVAPGSLTSSQIVANFKGGTSTIAEATAVASATVTPTIRTASTLQQSFGAFSGSLATLSRGGLSVQLNTVLPKYMLGDYISFLRIVNTSSADSTATISVRNDRTNAVVGSFTTGNIVAGATLELNSVDIDNGLTAAGATPITDGTYKVTVSGSFNGYVQNLLYNVVSKVFSDASGFRNGALTGDP